MFKIYLASSWRNPHQERVLQFLRSCNMTVYDFKHPFGPNSSGFSWDSIDPDWQQWKKEQFVKALSHPYAINGFTRDQIALETCQVLVMLTPCGRSAHTEFGCAVGNKYTIIYLTEDQEPELMYAMADQIVESENGLMNALNLASAFPTHPPRRSRIPQAIDLLHDYVWGLPTDQQIGKPEVAAAVNNSLILPGDLG